MSDIGEETSLAAPASVLSGRIKWFDRHRGYGFLVPDDGGGDVLVHFSVLAPLGRDSLPTGAILECEVAERARGRQAVKVLNLDLSEAQADEPPARRPRSGRPAGARDRGGPYEPATIKWFSRARGYGFVSRGEGEADVFLHMRVVRRAHLERLEPGERVEVRVGEGERGPVVTAIRRPRR